MRESGTSRYLKVSSSLFLQGRGRLLEFAGTVPFHCTVPLLGLRQRRQAAMSRREGETIQESPKCYTSYITYIGTLPRFFQKCYTSYITYTMPIAARSSPDTLPYTSTARVHFPSLRRHRKCVCRAEGGVRSS